MDLIVQLSGTIFAMNDMHFIQNQLDVHQDIQILTTFGLQKQANGIDSRIFVRSEDSWGSSDPEHEDKEFRHGFIEE